MIAQSHINTVNLALCASTTAHDSLCQFVLQPKRKPFPVVPGRSKAARPGVLCSHSLCRRTWLSWAESPRLLSAGPTSDFATPWPTLAAPLPYLFYRQIPGHNRTSDTSDPVPFSDFSLTQMLSRALLLSLFFFCLITPVLVLHAAGRNRQNVMQPMFLTFAVSSSLTVKTPWYRHML